MKILLSISYDGSGYLGYQTQKNGRSIQEELTRAAADLFGTRCDITGCSRTDRGVHANMFCATVEPHGDTFKNNIATEKIPQAMNIRLPDSIAVNTAEVVGDDFHARYNVISKEYIYRIYNKKPRSPFEVGRAWQLQKVITDTELETMEKAAAHFVGKRDFAACMATGSKIKDSTRHIFESEITSDGDIITYRVRADGFLYNMVRIIVGTLVDTAYGKINADDIPIILEARDRSRLGRTAPPDGLYLNKVFYE